MVLEQTHRATTISFASHFNGRLLRSVPVPVCLPVRLPVRIAGLPSSEDDDASFAVSCSGARLIAKVSSAAEALSSWHSVIPPGPSPLRHRLPPAAPSPPLSSSFNVFRLWFPAPTQTRSQRNVTPSIPEVGMVWRCAWMMTLEIVSREKSSQNTIPYF